MVALSFSFSLHRVRQPRCRRQAAPQALRLGEICRNRRFHLQLRLVQNIAWHAPPAALETKQRIAAAAFCAAARLIAAAVPELEDVAILPLRHLRSGIEPGLPLRPLQLRLGLCRHAISLSASCPAIAGKGDHPKGGGRGAGGNETLTTTGKHRSEIHSNRFSMRK
jgi:hypothetical protein